MFLQIVQNWNPDMGGYFIPHFHYDSLCHFDYQNSSQLAQAYNYQDADVPFVIHNIPELSKEVRDVITLTY